MKLFALVRRYCPWSMDRMIRRQLFIKLPTSSLPLRAFGTSATVHRSPSIADISPKDVPKFDARQKEFREGLKEAEQEKKKADSQSVAEYTTPSSASREAPTASNASNAASTVKAASEMALGSLSTHDPGAAREQASEEESSKRKGALSSLIYGTHEGQQMDQEIEKSFSQVLARGKYVHSIVFHSVKPDKVDEYVDLVGGWYPRVAKMQQNHVNLVGSWRTEVGDCDTFGLDNASDSVDLR